MAIKVINETSLSETVVIFYSTVYDQIGGVRVETGKMYDK